MRCIMEQKQSDRLGSTLLGMAIVLTVAICVPMSAMAADSAEQQQLVDKARLTIEAFGADPDLRWVLRDDIKEFKGIFIVPQLLRGAFVFGGRGGSGVLLVRNEKGSWSQPAFYSIGSVSLGFQAGADASQIVFLIRTTRGLEQFYKHDFKLGLDAGAAAGPVGDGGSLHGVTADLISYATGKGLFAGMALDGALVAVSDDSNAAYYGKEVRPTDILVKQSVENSKSDDLRAAVAKVIR
ncbi:lipid-binding SYLF domain-containing protein [Nitrospira sp. Nam74]